MHGQFVEGQRLVVVPLEPRLGGVLRALIPCGVGPVVLVYNVEGIGVHVVGKPLGSARAGRVLFPLGVYPVVGVGHTDARIVQLDVLQGVQGVELYGPV